MVTIHHLTLFWSAEFTGSQTAREWSHGASGVDIFFLISGFVMTISATSKRTPTALDFMRRRIIRIVPLYWMVTLAMCLKRLVLAFHPALAAPSAQPSTSLSYALACLFFIPARDSTGNVIPIVNAGWTLNLEMLFYVLFALALLLQIRPVRFLTPAILLLAIVGVLRPENWPPIATLTDPILLEFLGGVLLAYAFRGGFRVGIGLSALMGVTGFVALFVLSPGGFPLARELEWGIPALFILLAAVMLEERHGNLWPAWMLKVGDSSYSLYLVHILLRQPLIGLARRVPLIHNHIALFVIGGLALSLLLAVVSYWAVEKQLTSLLSRLTSTALPINIKRNKAAA